MPKRSSTPEPTDKKPAAKRPGTSHDHDFATIARNVVEEAIGEKLTPSATADSENSLRPKQHRTR